MPFGIRPSNVRVCHFTTRARAEVNGKSEMVPRKCCLVSELFFRTHTRARNRKETRSITSTSTITSQTETCFHDCDAFRIRPSNLRLGRLQCAGREMSRRGGLKPPTKTTGGLKPPLDHYGTLRAMSFSYRIYW